MKTTSRRAAVLYALAAFFLAGLIFFFVSVATHADDWAMNPANKHLFVGGELEAAGEIRDAKGTVLAKTEDGKRVFHSDAAIRKATLHLVGDTAGIISSGIHTTYKDELVGYNFVNGVYSMDGAGSGNHILLTIDANVCKTALNALDGRKGTVGVYNYKTGEILCMVSAPTYDVTNKPKDIETDESGKYDGIYMNRFLTGVYTPGSTFKIITAAAAIETIPDIGSRTFVCTGEYKTADGIIKCNGVHGRQSFEKALNNSCNAAFAQIGIEAGAEALTKTAAQLGFKTSVASDSQMKMGRMTIAQSKFDVSSANTADIGWASIGQYSDLVNPYHELMILGAIANGGTPVLPYVVSGVEGPGGFVSQKGSVTLGKSYFTNSTANKLTDLLRSNVVNAYGDSNFRNLEACGKTGTAEVGEGKEDHAWFVGFLKNKSYPLAFVVVVENGGSGRGQALPVAKKVIAAACESLDG